MPVVVHNWSTTAQTGDVQLTLPAGFTADAPPSRTARWRRARTTTVEFDVTNTDATLPATQDGESPSPRRSARRLGSET